MVDVYKTEDEQTEFIKSWWKDYGKAIILGLIIGLASIFGWRGYNNYLVVQGEAAATIYEKMIYSSNQKDNEKTKTLAEQIVTEHPSTVYGVFAKLMLAKLAVQANDLLKAKSELYWVLDSTKHVEMQHVARLRLANLLIELKELDEAEKLLAIDNTGEFTPYYDEIRGDVFIKNNKIEAAGDAYKKANMYSNLNNDAKPFLQMKLNDLGKE